MSKLDELIAKYCPDGVEYRTIGACVQNVSRIKWAEHKNEEFRYIDLTSVDRHIHQITETQTIDSENAPSRAQQIVAENDIIFGATRPLLRRYCCVTAEYDGEICSTGFCVLRADEKVVLFRYLYHIISSTDFFAYVETHQKGASYPAILDKDTKKYRFPVPPLEVQREIVRVLDNFTFLTAELTAELTARRKQYEYYRDSLLSFDQDSRTVKKAKLKDIANIFRGDYITKKGSNPGTIPVILGGQEPAYYIDRYNHEGEVVVIARSGVSAGFVSYWDEPIFITDGFGFEARGEIVTTRYLYYALKQKQPELNLLKRGAGVPHVSGEVINNVELSIPELEVQHRIVEVLDNFESLCNDLGIGLPAEIEARQKQYEYYRDLLLTFVETGETIARQTDRQTDRQTEHN